MLFIREGSRNCSIVGAALLLGFELLDRFLIDGLKKGVFACWEADFAHDEHVQAASLGAIRERILGKLFMVDAIFNGVVLGLTLRKKEPSGRVKQSGAGT